MQVSKLQKQSRVSQLILLIGMFLVQVGFAYGEDNSPLLSEQGSNYFGHRSEKEDWKATSSLAFQSAKEARLSGMKGSAAVLRKAIERYHYALRLAVDAQDARLEGIIHNDLGICYGLLGERTASIQSYERALVIFGKLEDHFNEASALTNLGKQLTQAGFFRDALDRLQRALVLREQVNDQEGLTYTLVAIGVAHSDMGDYERALDVYAKALPIVQDLKILAGEYSILNNMAFAYDALGKSDLAVKHLNKALELQIAEKDLHAEAYTRANLGRVYGALGQYANALENLDAALKLSRISGGKRIEGISLTNLAALHTKLDDSGKAAAYAAEALGIYRNLEDGPNEAKAFSILMTLSEKNHNNPLAIFYGKLAVNLYQRLRSQMVMLDKRSQDAFVRSKADTYKDLADLLIISGRLSESEQILNLLKTEEFTEYLRGDEVALPIEQADLSEREIEWEKRYQEIAQHATSIGQQYDELKAIPNRTSEQEQLLAKYYGELVIANKGFQKFIDSLLSEFQALPGATEKIFSIRENQGLSDTLRELGTGTVVVYTMVLEDKIRFIVQTSVVQVDRASAIRVKDLNRKIIEFREALQSTKKNPLPMAQELYNVIVRPLINDFRGTNAKVIMWSLDGVLRYLPIAALHDGSKYFVEEFASTVFTPASRDRLKDLPTKNWHGIGFGVSKALGEFDPLPSVEEELAAVFKTPRIFPQAGVVPGAVLLNEDFTAKSFKAELNKSFPLVHIASHFKFNPLRDNESFLLLGDGQHFSIANIKVLPNIFGGVDLLTLSACNTAMGGTGLDGREVEGFAVLAQRQGAKSVVASLWSIADTSTGLLMQHFYRLRENILVKTKLEALRGAQLALLYGKIKPVNRVTDYSHPYYWAPFIMIGNWR